MNSKLALTAIIMFAVVMGIASMTPALAAKNKVPMCHYSAAEEVLDIDGVPTGEVIPEHWKIINISANGNAVNAHENNHAQDNGDGTFQPDFEITDPTTQADCDTLILAFPPPPDA